MTIEEKLVDIADGEQKVYDAGYNNMREKTWQMITANGTRAHYTRAFYSTNYSGFEFPKPVKVKGNAMYMFYDYRGKYLPENIDLSEATVSGTWESSSAYNLFGWSTSYLLKVYDMGLRAPDEYRLTFQYCYSLKEIEKLRVKKTTKFYDTFLRCDVLKDIVFEGEIGENLNMSGCSKLSEESLANILDCLYDYASEGNTSSHTLNLGSTNIAKLTQQQQQIALDKGWTLA